MSEKAQERSSREQPSKEQKTSPKMEVINPHAAGIDIGSMDHWVACPSKDGTPNVRTFKTDTQSLNEIADWLMQEGVSTVAMESTGVYWIACFELLEAKGLLPVLVDSRSIGRVAGRKTDMMDCQWLQQLHTYGMLRGCFRPKDATLKLRSLLRMCRTLKHQQDDWIRRMQKALDQMNIRVHRAVSDITGMTGMRIIRAIVGGERDPQELARLRDSRCRKDEEQMARELTGTWREEHLFNLSTALDVYDYFEKQIQRAEQHIHAELASIGQQRALEGKATIPVEQVRAHPNPEKQGALNKRGGQALRISLMKAYGTDLTLIEGIGAETAASILGELGPDIQASFSSEKAFIAYLGFAPNMAISGGKTVRKKKRAHHGTHVIHRLLRTAASTVQRSHTALGAYYRKIAYRKGAGTAVFATARKLSQHIYRALAYGVEYVSIGLEEENRQAEKRHRDRLEKQAAKLGLKLVEATP